MWGRYRARALSYRRFGGIVLATESIFFMLVLSLMAAGYLLGRQRAVRLRAGGAVLHSREGHYGWYVTLWGGVPAVLVAIAGLMVDDLGGPAIHWSAVLAGVLAVGGGGVAVALRQVRPSLRARNMVEGYVIGGLIAAALISILTTIGIVLSIVFEAVRFFQIVSFWEFITGTTWSTDTAFLAGAGREGEQAAQAAFGSVPLFAGTFLISAIAMLVAMPIGLLSAVYMAEYAPPAVRTAAKPLLEILAGIPTVVYGFFAAITIAPMIVAAAEALGLDASYNNALAPGLVMGIMIIPLVSSLSDDVISAVPQSLRDGALALGVTQAETVKHVLLPAALPGIVAAFILGVSRALGETMIVVMAAGLAANLTANPLEAVTTVTVRIVDALTGDQAYDSPETLSAFALGLVLFVVTLALNLFSMMIARRFHQRYE